MSRDLSAKSNRCAFSSITRHCFLSSMNCPAKLISKAFFSRLVRSPTFSGRGLVAGLRSRERKEAMPFVSKRRSTSENEKWKWTRTKGMLAMEKGRRGTGREWKMKRKDESARCCITDLTLFRFLPDRQSDNATPPRDPRC